VGGVLGTPTIDTVYSKGTWSVTRPSVGVYCLTPPAGVSPSNTPAYVTVEWGESSGFDLLAYWVKLNTFQCAANQYAVRTYRFPGGAPALSNNVAFTLLVP
jgi:hypothetical protein